LKMRHFWKAGLSLAVAVVMTAAGFLSAETEYRPKTWWKLDIEISPLAAITAQDFEGNRVRCLYFTYKVTNKSEKTILYVPEFFLETNTGKSYLDLIRLGAQAKVEKQRKRRFLNSAQMIGEVKPGEIKEGIAFFPEVDPKAKKLTLVALGLTNEYRVLERFGTEIIERKAFTVSFDWPGSSVLRERDPIIYRDEEQWVWRR